VLSPKALALLSPKKAALHGMICSDGHFCIFAMREGKPRVSYRIVLAEPNAEIRKLFIRLVWQLYGVRARDKPGLRIVRAFGAHMMRDLLPYGPYGKLRWSAPLPYLNKDSARAWARSYFDGDGDVHLSSTISKCRVRAKSVNLSGLEGVNALLWSFFGIESRIYKIKTDNPNWSQAYELDIITKESLLKYYKLVGFNHPEKRIRLRQLIELINRRGV
jgi:hypothetical protein